MSEIVCDKMTRLRDAVGKLQMSHSISVEKVCFLFREKLINFCNVYQKCNILKMTPRWIWITGLLIKGQILSVTL